MVTGDKIYFVEICALAGELADFKSMLPIERWATEITKACSVCVVRKNVTIIRIAFIKT